VFGFHHQWRRFERGKQNPRRLDQQPRHPLSEKSLRVLVAVATVAGFSSVKKVTGSMTTAERYCNRLFMDEQEYSLRRGIVHAIGKVKAAKLDEVLRRVREFFN
jgi:hypothetical protein